MKTLKSIILATSLISASLLFPNKTKADDIFKGLRGPSSIQIDERIGYSKNEVGTETLSNYFVLKYWNGSSFGQWGFLSLLYKYVETPSSSSNGLGDINLGIGPRATTKNLHLFGYTALTFPTGNNKSTPKLGTGRHDIKLGGLTTILSDNKSLEVDGAIEYTLTENTPTDILNEVYFGLVGGGEITSKTRAVIGVTDLIKGNDFMLNLRVVGRYTISKKLHFELVGDKTMASNNIPSTTNISVYTRYNLFQ